MEFHQHAAEAVILVTTPAATTGQRPWSTPADADLENNWLDALEVCYFLFVGGFYMSGSSVQLYQASSV